MATKAVRPKHVPQRTCVVCRSKDAKRRLTRLVRTAEGVLVDPTGKMNGRGAYLCDDPACWEKASNSQALGAALRTELTTADKERLAATRPAVLAES